ncbi:MAG: PAS domain S-box protein [Alphaproteobacteria bacterium]|nr:PAS domain S-box protein [Alphaproteobacteria bacterium]
MMRAIILIPLAYLLISAALLGLVLVILRGEAMDTGERLTSALARVIEEQTTRTIQSVDQTLDMAEHHLNNLVASGADNEASVRESFRALLPSHPFIKTIWVLDRQGRMVFSSDNDQVGWDLSGRHYFLHYLDAPDTGFVLNPPVRSRITDRWFIPATRPWRQSDGRLGGVIVAAVDPEYLEKTWALNDNDDHAAVTLFRRDAILLARSPHVDDAMGKSFAEATLFKQLSSGRPAGTFQTLSIIDRVPRVFSYRTLSAYPDFLISVGRSNDEILAAWSRYLWVAAIAWILTSLALGSAFFWLVRVWKRRSQSEAALSASQERLLSVTEHVFDALIISDRNGTIFDFNKSAERIFGYSADEAVGQSLRIVMSEPRRSASDASLIAYLTAIHQAAETEIQEVEGRRKDGTVFPLEMGIATISDASDNPLFVATLRDISARKTAEAQSRQTQRIEAVGQLTGGVAHDFNNMLMVILGNADMMLDELPANSSLRPLCETILHAAEGSAELTARLLAFSRQQPLQPRRMQVNEVVEKTADLLKRTLGENVSIKLDVAADAWDVMVDRAQLEAAIMNLAINGRDAMLNGGALTVETDNAHIDETYVAANPDATVGDFVAVVVSDNGTGMTQDVVQRVFEPFFTTKEVGKGTGLGLSMVYGFVRQTGGHVKIYSEVGYGTSVKMYFPRAAEGTELAEATPEAGSALPSGHEAILVVEDDARVRDHVSGQLKHLGYRITSAKDGPEALNILKGTTFDLLFTDVVMPGGLTGRDLAENAKQLKPSIKVLYTSGYTQDAIVHHGRLDAGVHLLSKPYRLRDLAGKVRAVLDAA